MSLGSIDTSGRGELIILDGSKSLEQALRELGASERTISRANISFSHASTIGKIVQRVEGGFLIGTSFLNETAGASGVVEQVVGKVQRTVLDSVANDEKYALAA